MSWFRRQASLLIILLLVIASYGTPLSAKEINFGRYHALLIANYTYKYWRDLKTPLNDVKEISKILKEKYRFHEDNIKTLENTTRDDIIDCLEGYRDRLTSHDNLLIYYAGHGKLRKDGGYWIGVDARKNSRSRWLHYGTISDLIDSDNGMKARHVLVIADSCYAGALTRDESENAFARKHPGEKEQAWFLRMQETNSRTALTSGGTEPVIDRAGTAIHSIFAQELIRRLNSNTNVLETKSLYGLISKDVHSRALRIAGSDAQAPQYDPIPGTGHCGGDFLFVLTESVVQVPQATVDDGKNFGIRGETTPFTPQQIRQAQEHLQRMGFNPGAADGVLGPGTSEALKQFQDRENLPVTGELNRRTWDALAKVVLQSPPAPSRIFTNSLGMKFNYIPPGTFTMGSPEYESDRGDDETQHRVILTKGFYMQTTEVTQAQWRKLMGGNPSKFKGCGDDCPVETVSWDKVQEFIDKLNQKESGRQYRLPTEAQWEYAARAGTQTPFYSGDTEADLNSVGWYRQNSNETPHPVARKEPNRWGLYDMHGNVWEWCQDWYGHYTKESATDPSGPPSGSGRVIRGGSWGNPARLCRSAFRGGVGPDDRGHNLGFRLVLLPGQ